MVNCCVNVYLDSVSVWIIVILLLLLGLLPGHLLCIILNVGSGGTRLCIDMHSLVILFIYTISIWCFDVYVKLLFVKKSVLFICIVVIILYTCIWMFLSEINYQSIKQSVGGRSRVTELPCYLSFWRNIPGDIPHMSALQLWTIYDQLFCTYHNQTIIAVQFIVVDSNKLIGLNIYPI